MIPSTPPPKVPNTNIVVSHDNTDFENGYFSSYYPQADLNQDQKKSSRYSPDQNDNVPPISWGVHDNISAPYTAVTEFRSGVIMKALQDLQKNNDFDVVLERILDSAYADEDDPELLPAELSSVKKAVRMVSDTGLIMGTQFPRALAGPDGDGGLSVEWRHPDGFVKLIVSSHCFDIFHLYGKEYAREEATTDILVKRLRELVS